MISHSILSALSVITEEEQSFLSGSQTIDRSLYMEGSGDVISGKKLLAPSRLITVRPHTRFIHFPEHVHDYVEMVYMCRGSTTHIVNGTRIELRQGELLLMGQNTRQEIMPAGEDDIAVNFIVRPEFFSATLPFLGDDETPLRRFIVDCLCGETDSGYLLFQVSDVLPVQNLIENLVWTLISDTPNRRNINQTTMGLLFMTLINYADRLTVHNPEQGTILQVLRYVEEHYKDGSLTEIAELLHYDPAWLSREIKRRTGRNYTDLVQEKRLSQAVWLLKNTGKRVDEIALAVGYENVSYFHRIFARQYGISPRKMRGSQEVYRNEERK